ncbi:unnamed protein product [Lymnaea stagnalis]|uniref:Uncharacterized protein n=1 Tax=Lymnaea stagnalis TaxID=6523 RepID=A0AAV2HEH9_LYMST
MYKQFLTITGCLTTAIFLYFFRCDGVQGQSVYLDPTSVRSVSTCSSGLRDGLDFYIFRGIVDATTAKMSNVVDFQVRLTYSNRFAFLCTVSLLTCVTPNPQPCYCAVQRGSVYEIVANRPADISYSNAMIRIYWESVSGASVFSNELKVPTIYDMNDVTTSLTLNDAPMACPATVSLGSVIKFQCQHAPSPCDVKIFVDGRQVVKGEHTATYTVSTNITIGMLYSFTFTYSVCGGSFNTTACFVTRGTVIG